MLYLHGGGFALRLPICMRGLRRASLARSVRVHCSSTIALRPSIRFLRLSMTASSLYRWLLAQGVAPRDVVIAGDSAGANLTLVTLLGAKAAGSPATDMRDS